MTIRKMALSFVGIALLGSMFSARAQQSDSDEEGQLRFRFVGPRVGNRIAAVAGLPGDASTYYAGAASGGVWKSIDGGNHWSPVFDKQTAAAIGALAVAPSDPSTVWAGSGEAWVIRDSDVTGNGIYKSTDAGKTWTNMGLPESGRIGRIVIHPSNPDIVFACVLGRTTGPQPDRGVFRTTDGGHNWERVLFAGENVGCSGLSMDPHNPHTLFAGMWQVEMHPWGEFSGGPGSGIYVSRDGGTKWTRIEEHGLPHSPLGKIDVAVAPTNSNRVFALIQTKDQGSLWRSDDAGEHWKAVNYQRALIGRAGYYIRLAISPDSDNEVLVANSSFWQSLDGGENFKEVPWGGDTHDIWFDPTNADRFAIADDGGFTALPCRSARCTTSMSTIRFLITSTATCRTTETCAAQAFPSIHAKPAGIMGWGGANPASRFPTWPIQTLCGPLATATKSLAGMPAASTHAPSVRGCIPWIRHPTRSNIAVIGQRRWPWIPSITTLFITAAR
jgi:photosystem II stability/assembly factor-like uncharacterized protein